MKQRKIREYTLTNELLLAYQEAAIANARELREEAALLSANGHLARGYFLSVASIEETGKAVMAFQGRGRNLRNPSVASRLKLNFEDHAQKIISAFYPLIIFSSDTRAAVQGAIELATSIKSGREPSMYTDINSVGPTVQSPRQVLRTIACTDCLRLATDCLDCATRYFDKETPMAVSKAEDELFSMKASLHESIMKSPEFWEFFVQNSESGKPSYAEAVIQFHKHHAQRP